MMLAKVPDSDSSENEVKKESRVPVLIPFEEHERLMNETAKRASRETIESLRRKPARRENDGGAGGVDFGSGDEDDDELDFFASQTNKSIKNMVSSVATLKRAFEQPPSQIEQAMYQAFTQKTIDSLSGNSEKKKNWYDEILSSVAHGLGQRTPELIDTLTRNFGSEWVKQTATGLLNPGAMINSGGPGGGYNSQGQGGQGGMQGGQRGNNSNLNQDAVDQIMALEPNNPEHVAAYAEIQGNIDINDARKMLQIHQDIFMNKMKRNAAQMGDVGGAGNVGQNRQNIPPNIPVNPGVNSDVPPIWAQAMMGKLLELEKKVNDNIGISNVEHISHVDMGNTSIGKVQTPAEFQRELEEELRRDKEKLNNRVNGNVNKWEDEPSTAVGMLSQERRLEESKMKHVPVHDASADLIKKEIEDQKEKLKVISVVPIENVEAEIIDIPADIGIIDIPDDIKSDIETIEEKVNFDGVHNKAPKSVLDMKEETKEETNVDLSNIMSKGVKQYAKGSQGWLKAQKEKKGVQ